MSLVDLIIHGISRYRDEVISSVARIIHDIIGNLTSVLSSRYFLKHKAGGIAPERQ